MFLFTGSDMFSIQDVQRNIDAPNYFINYLCFNRIVLRRIFHQKLLASKALVDFCLLAFLFMSRNIVKIWQTNNDLPNSPRFSSTKNLHYMIYEYSLLLYSGLVFGE